MFPRALSEGPFSLVSNSSSSSGSGACDALSICVALADDGSLSRVVSIGPSRVRVTHRLSYDDVDADLGLGPGMCRYEDLQLLFDAARLRCACVRPSCLGLVVESALTGASVPIKPRALTRAATHLPAPPRLFVARTAHRREWRMSQHCIDIDNYEAKLEVPLAQLDATTPAVTCTKLSQVGGSALEWGARPWLAQTSRCPADPSS
jgi:hypothetical protein